MINRPKILLVDDNLDILKMIKSQLSKDEFNVDMAFDGAEAIEKIKKIDPLFWFRLDDAKNKWS